MAAPTIQYNASTGSDTAASGAGPATAVTGAAAAHTNGVSSTIITLTNTPDLSGVATDGSHALWLNRGSNERHFSKITGKSDGASVTVEDSFTIAAGSAVDYAIGGIRKTLEYRTTFPDWNDSKASWIFEFDAGTYTLTQFVQVGSTTATNTDVPTTWRAKSGAASRPIIRQSANKYCWGNDVAGNFLLEGLQFDTSIATASTTYFYILQSNTCLTIRDCVIDPSGSSTNPAYAIRIASGISSTINIVDSYITGADVGVGYDGAADDSDLFIHGCTFDGQGAAYFDTAAIQKAGDIAALCVSNCLIYEGNGDGISITTDDNHDYIIVGNTIVDNAGDGIVITAPSTPRGTGGAIINNLIAYNGAYGIDCNTSNLGDLIFPVADHNAFYSNTSGNRNSISAGANDVTLTADPFEARGSDDYRLNSTAGGGAACKGVGLPGAFPDGT